MYVAMHDPRDPETNEPLFWCVSGQWDSLHHASVFVVDNDTKFDNQMFDRFPKKAGGFVELPTPKRVYSLP